MHREEHCAYVYFSVSVWVFATIELVFVKGNEAENLHICKYRVTKFCILTNKKNNKHFESVVYANIYLFVV